MRIFRSQESVLLVFITGKMCNTILQRFFYKSFDKEVSATHSHFSHRSHCVVTTFIRKTFCNYAWCISLNFFVYALPMRLVVQYKEQDLQKPESTWRDVSLSRDERIFESRCYFFCCFFCQTIVSVPCVVRAVETNLFLTTVCLTRTVMEFSVSILRSIDIYVWQVLYAVWSLLKLRVVGNFRSSSKKANAIKMCVPLQIITRHWEKFSQFFFFPGWWTVGCILREMARRDAWKWHWAFHI